MKLNPDVTSPEGFLQNEDENFLNTISVFTVCWSSLRVSVSWALTVSTVWLPAHTLTHTHTVPSELSMSRGFQTDSVLEGILSDLFLSSDLNMSHTFLLFLWVQRGRFRDIMINTASTLTFLPFYVWYIYYRSWSLQLDWRINFINFLFSIH